MIATGIDKINVVETLLNLAASSLFCAKLLQLYAAKSGLYDYSYRNSSLL